MVNCIIVGMGGFFGAIARYLIGLIPINPQSGFPIKTLMINIVGAFLIGVVVAIGVKKDWNPQWILFLKVGICGGFTTFSSFALETSDLMKSGKVSVAVLYAVLSITVGVVAVIMGEEIVK